MKSLVISYFEVEVEKVIIYVTKISSSFNPKSSYVAITILLTHPTTLLQTDVNLFFLMGAVMQRNSRPLISKCEAFARRYGCQYENVCHLPVVISDNWEWVIWGWEPECIVLDILVLVYLNLVFMGAVALGNTMGNPGVSWANLYPTYCG